MITATDQVQIEVHIRQNYDDIRLQHSRVRLLLFERKSSLTVTIREIVDCLLECLAEFQTTTIRSGR